MNWHQVKCGEPVLGYDDEDMGVNILSCLRDNILVIY